MNRRGNWAGGYKQTNNQHCANNLPRRDEKVSVHCVSITVLTHFEYSDFKSSLKNVLQVRDFFRRENKQSEAIKANVVDVFFSAWD